jgi:hypothetical protein
LGGAVHFGGQIFQQGDGVVSGWYDMVLFLQNKFPEI